MKNLSGFTPFFVAAVLPLFAFNWLIPKGVIQLDLAILWLVVMIVVGLPMVFAEFALAKRSGKTPVLGMQILTRQSDSSLWWRVFGWLSVALAMVLSARLIVLTNTALSSLIDVPAMAVGFVLAIAALIISFWGNKLLPIALIATLLGIITGLVGTDRPHIALTPTSLSEWGLVVAMGLVSIGAGSGLYWFGSQEYQDKHLTRPVLLVWVTALVAGLVGFVVPTVSLAGLPLILYGLGAFLMAAFLLHYANNQLAVKLGNIKANAISGIVLLGLVIGLALLLDLALLLGFVVAFLGLVASLVLAIFAGWQMKISHLRKSFAFKSEIRYNLWRIAVRVMTPLAVLVALVGLLMGNMA